MAGSAVEPGHYPWQQIRQKLALRQLLLNSCEEAREVLQQLDRGELFEYALRSVETTSGERLGSYVGEFKPEDLRPQIAAALQGREIYSAPVLVQAVDSFLLVQRILPFEIGQWQAMAGEGSGPETRIRKSTKPPPADEYMERQAIDPFKVRIHAGAYLGRQGAVRETENLKKLGSPAFLLIRQKADGKTWHYVIAGQYDSRQQAEIMLKQLQKQGYESFIVPPKAR